MKKVVIGAVVLAVAAIAIQIFAFGPSDKQMIQSALDESLLAAREGRPSPVLEYLSRNFEINGQRMSERPEIAKAVQMAKPEITVMNREPQITDSTATINSSVKVKLDYMGLNIDQTFENVTITFTKESGTRMLVVPYPKWRISGVSAAGLPTPSGTGLGG